MTATQVIVDHGNSTWDNWALILLGVALALGAGLLAWVANSWSDAFWAGVEEQRKADAHVATKCRTWADLLPTAKDEARMVARVEAGLEHVRSWPQQTKKTTRLADFRAAQTKQKKAS